VDRADLSLVKAIEDGRHRPKLTTFLSPFDNLFWDRRRTYDLFGFEYRAEMYVPAAKRQYGYYVMPLLHRGQLVGRLDPKADRKSKVLLVRAIYLEPGQAVDEALVADIGGTLREFMAFHGSERLAIERSEPQALAGKLMEHLGAQGD
jgi:uncharacterized protein YcaQ